MMKFLMAGFSAALVAGCAVGPNYVRPEIETPGRWQNPDSVFAADTAAVRSETAWWGLFGDTVLTNLIAAALQENADVRIAAARVEEVMGRYGVARSDFFPKLGAAGAASRGQLLSDEAGRGLESTRNRFQVNLAADWEIDLWGKLRRATEAARADLLATEEARRGVVLTTVALVASTYVDLLSMDWQLEIARQTALTRREALDLFEVRREKGDLSDLIFSQAEAEYWLAMSQIPLIEENIAFLENMISCLVGRNPGPVARGKTLEDLAPPAVPVGLPSELLERRPDIRFAEEQLRAANARIGVARALYFPSLSLSGLLGYASDDLSDLVNSDTRTWRVGGDVLAPIFRFGEIKGQVKTAEGRQKQALYAYVEAVHNAFRDTENALVRRRCTNEQLQAEGKRVAALATYARLARMRFDEGVTSYLEVLDAERALFATVLAYTQTTADLHKSVIALHQALAGSWLDAAAAESFRIEEGIKLRGQP